MTTVGPTSITFTEFFLVLIWRSVMRRVILGALLTFFLTRCATVTRGPMQSIRVGSKPAGASVKLRDCGAGSTDSAKTPAVVFVNRRATRCSLTFTHPQYGSRTVSLLRIGGAWDRTAPPDELRDATSAGVEVVGKAAEVGSSLPAEAAPVVAPIIVGAAGAVVIGGAVWGLSRSVDAMSGANYQQNRSIVLIDFNKPIPKVVGRYSLVRVNGAALPTTTWLTGNCQISTNSGRLVLEENGRWNSIITEQEFCGKRKHRPVESAESAAHGVFSVDGDRILLESERGIAVAVLQRDRLEVTIRGPGAHDGEATYTLQLSQ